MNWRLQIHSTEIPATGDVSQLLQTLARFPGDMVLLHEAPNGRAVIAVNPLIAFSAWRQGVRCRVVLDTVPELKQPDFQRIPTDPIDPSEALNLWESILSGVSFFGTQIPAELFGWMGFVGYELGVMLELPDLYADHDATLPLLHWQLFSRYFIFDPQKGIWNLIYLDRPDTQIKTVDKVWSEMRNILNLDLNATQEINSAATDLEIIQTPDESHFHRILRKCLNYIAAGDIYQANLSEEWLVAPQ